ncbi:MAG: porin family protein [Oceanicaulis sp.]
MKTILLASAAALLATSAASAQDAQGQFKLGGGYTFLDFDDAEFHAVTVRGGYDFHKFFGIEGEAIAGLNEETVTVMVEDLATGIMVPVDVDTSLQYGLGIFFKAHYPFTERFSAFARAGYVWTEIEAGFPTFTTSDDTDGNAYGVGAEIAINEEFSARGEYTMYDYGDDSNADSVSVSLIRRF